MSMKTPRPGRKECCDFWFADDVGIELLRARYVTHRFVPHTHDEYSVGVIVDGALGFRHERLDGAAPAGTVKAVNPGDLHTGFPVGDEGWTYRAFFVSADIMGRIAADLDGDGGLPVFPRRPLDDAELSRDLYDLHRILEHCEDPLEREAATISTLGGLIQRHASGRRPIDPVEHGRDAVTRARELIARRYGDPLSLDELAEVAQLSSYHFLRVFRRETGLTPHAYLLQVRVEQARRMLAEGASVVESAMACGFADQSHLTRRFKQIIGVTPGRYATAMC